MNDKVSVVIPAFNNWPLTKACIDTLLAATTSDVLADVVVVDDGSTDGVSAQWAAAQRTVIPLLSAENRGFSQACNLGAAAGRGEVLLFLNNDAFVRPGSIATLLATLAAEPTIGVVGAKLLYADGTLQHAGLALLDGPVSRWWHVHRQLPGSFADAGVARDLLAVTGAALMIRRSLFLALGGFDAGYTNGLEDVDLCLRAWCRGMRVRYEPRAVIEHLESATRGQARDTSSNERRFIDRWAAVLADAPRYPLAEIPPVALAVGSGCTAEDRRAVEHVRSRWAAHLGAKVSLTRPGSRIDRARVELSAALARRRPTLEIAWADATLGAATGPTRVAFVAPRSAAEAHVYATAPNVRAWWTPTAASRDALLGAGASSDRVMVIPLGAAADAFIPRAGSVVVAARKDDADVLHELQNRAPLVQTHLLGADVAPNFADIDIVVARCGGDRWGLLVSSALAHGCRVIVSPPIDSFVAQTFGVTVVDDALMLDALVEHAADIAGLRGTSVAVALAARRRLDPTLAAQHAAETARALVHGTRSAALVEVGPALAAHFRRARIEAGS